MNTETFAGSTFGRPFVKMLAAAMESRFRYRFFPPLNILNGVDKLTGQRVLESDMLKIEFVNMGNLY